MRKFPGKRVPILVALDIEPAEDNFFLVRELKGKVAGFKVGPHLFWKHRDVAARIKEIDEEAILFLDLKFHDIPSTVSRCIRNLTDGFDMFTFSMLSGIETIRAAVKENPEGATGVGILTSLDDGDIRTMFGEHIGGVKAIQERLFSIAVKEGVRNLVMAAWDLHFAPQEVRKIVPGIKKWASFEKDSEGKDQKRGTSFEEAIRLGADFVVVGRLLYGNRDTIKESIREAFLTWEKLINSRYS